MASSSDGSPSPPPPAGPKHESWTTAPLLTGLNHPFSRPRSHSSLAYGSSDAYLGQQSVNRDKWRQVELPGFGLRVWA
jgi:hypothetical protein